MGLFEFIILTVATVLWSAILAKFLQLAFKLVLGEANAYTDSYRICFLATFVHVLFSDVLPSFIGGSLGFEIAGPFLVIGLMTYLVAKEIGNLMQSFIIALVLEGITFLFMLALIAIVVGAVVGDALIS